MDLTIRKGKDGVWGFVETYDVYRYSGKGYVSVLMCITPDLELSKPFAFRDESYIPLEQIEEEVGIDKYIKAKKPFYSVLGNGIIAQIKAGLNYETGEFIPEKTTYTLYKTVNTDSEFSFGKIKLSPILEIPENINDAMIELASKVIIGKGDRLEFLKSRI